MKIALDAACGDFGAAPNVEGAARAVKEQGYEVILVGDKDLLKAEMSKQGVWGMAGLSVHHTSQTVDMESSDPAKECRTKKDASIIICADLVKNGKADAMVSAGNSGASMAAALMKMGRIKGILRPAIGAPLPTANGRVVLLDAGANAECRPEHLLQFAIMGSAYAEKAFGVVNPKVGLLSIGEEESKGNSLVKATVPHMRNIGVNYYGTVEGRDIPAGITDVVVTDGFTGNICLKLSEGIAKLMFTLIKKEVSKSLIHSAALAVAKPSLRKIKALTDPDYIGGAPLLGVDGVAIVSHGKASAFGIFNALKLAAGLVERDFIKDIAAQSEKCAHLIKELKSADEK